MKWILTLKVCKQLQTYHWKCWTIYVPVSHPGCDAAQALYRQLVYWTLYSFLRVARCLTLDQMMREPISSQFICPQVFAAKLHRYKYKNHYRSHYIPNINPPEAVKSAPSYIFIQCFQNFWKFKYWNNLGTKLLVFQSAHVKQNATLQI